MLSNPVYTDVEFYSAYSFEKNKWATDGSHYPLTEEQGNAVKAFVESSPMFESKELVMWNYNTYRTMSQEFDEDTEKELIDMLAEESKKHHLDNIVMEISTKDTFGSYWKTFICNGHSESVEGRVVYDDPDYEELFAPYEEEGNEEDFQNKFLEKLQTELAEFESKFNGNNFTLEQTFDFCSELGIKRDIVWEFQEYADYSGRDCKILLAISNPLQALYDDFIDRGASRMEDIRYCINDRIARELNIYK